MPLFVWPFTEGTSHEAHSLVYTVVREFSIAQNPQDSGLFDAMKLNSDRPRDRDTQRYAIRFEIPCRALFNPERGQGPRGWRNL